MNVIQTLQGCAFSSVFQLILHSPDEAMWAAALKTPEVPDECKMVVVCV